MERYQVSQPAISISEERQRELVTILLGNASEVSELWLNSSSPYLGWDKFNAKYRSGLLSKAACFKGINATEAWFMVNVRRRLSNDLSPVTDTSGHTFNWSKNIYIEKQLHEFDMKLGGNLMSDTFSSGKLNRERYLRQSLVEEAIASSQLEGAATTRQAAKKMLAENKKPKSHGEWMIYNNYHTIRKIEQETANYPLSRDVLLDLHVLMTKNAIDPEQMGRWRRDNDDIVIKRIIGSVEYVAHIPPIEEQLQPEIDKLIAFANDDGDTQLQFLHPIIKAIMLHFWFAYIHPFCDGNGRLARSLFYWYLLKNGYWFVSYVPISTVIKKSPIGYADAYSFSEQYGSDMTYFIDYNVQKLGIALRMFDEHVNNERRKTATIDSLIPEKDLNEREKQVLHHLLNKPEDSVTAQRHSDFHEVSWITASQDLKRLAKLNYLESVKRGKEVQYRASDKLLKLSGEVI